MTAILGRCSVCNQQGSLTRRADGMFEFLCACVGAGFPPIPPPPRPPSRPGRRPRLPAPPAGAAFAPVAQLRAGELTLWLPRLPRSDEGPNGRDWRVRDGAARAWHALVDQALRTLPADRTAGPWPAVRISYDVFRASAHTHDRDNLVVALGKPIQDALVGAGVLPGDGPDVVIETPRVDQLRSPLPWGFVVVTVRRAAGERVA